MISLRPGMRMTPEALAQELVEIQYERNDIGFGRGMFRLRGDVLEIIPIYHKEDGVRVEFFGDEIERVSEFDLTTGHTKRAVNHYALYPATHYATAVTGREAQIRRIEEDLEERIRFFEERGLKLEAQRIAQRTHYDIEMLRSWACSGIENYSRYFDGASRASRPSLLDYFPGTSSALSMKATSPSPDPGHVRGGQGQEDRAGGLWLPPAQRV